MIKGFDIYFEGERECVCVLLIKLNFFLNYCEKILECYLGILIIWYGD